MTTIENAREFCNNTCIPKQKITIEKVGEIDIERLLVSQSKHVLQQVIHFLELNEKKTVRSIIDELKGNV